MLHRLIAPLPPGRYALDSPAFLRWWLLQRLSSLTSPLYLDHVKGTAIHTAWLRLLGARIGSSVRISPAATIADPHLLHIGDGTRISAASIAGSTVRGRVLAVGPVAVGRQCRVGDRCVLLPCSTLKDGVALEPLTVVTEGQVRPHRGWIDLIHNCPASFTC